MKKPQRFLKPLGFDNLRNMKYETLIAEQYYHIYNRGNNGEDIFIEKQNYAYFLGLVKKHILPVANILCYCLLKNHFHFLVKTKSIADKKITQAFSNFFNAYAKAINKKYKRNGSLFQYKFKRIKIENEDYLRKLIVYINLNPVHHKFCNDYKNYRYSSFKGLVSTKSTLLERTFVIGLFDDKKNFKFSHELRKCNIKEQEYYLE